LGVFALIPSAGNILPATSQVNDLVTGTKRMNRIWKNNEKYYPIKFNHIFHFGHYLLK
jgi:hypothetical protein